MDDGCWVDLQSDDKTYTRRLRGPDPTIIEHVEKCS